MTHPKARGTVQSSEPSTENKKADVRAVRDDVGCKWKQTGRLLSHSFRCLSEVYWEIFGQIRCHGGSPALANQVVAPEQLTVTVEAAFTSQPRWRHRIALGLVDIG